jgi:hypothetical protein
VYAIDGNSQDNDYHDSNSDVGSELMSSYETLSEESGSAIDDENAASDIDDHISNAADSAEGLTNNHQQQRGM